MGQQGVALKNHGGVPLVGGHGIDGLVAQINFALVGTFKAGDHAQRGGLSAAGGTQKRDKGTGLDLQIGVLHSIEILFGLGVLIDFGNMFQANALFLFRHINYPP